MTWNLRRASRPEARILAWMLIFSVGCLAAVPAVHAGIVSSVNVTVLGGPPAPNVLPGSNTTTPFPIVFPEVLGGVVPAGGVAVDHNGSVVSAAPVESANIVNPLLVSAVIPAGTRVDSYLFHFDPPDAAFPSAANFYDPGASPYSILFSGKILGVQLFSSGYTALKKPSPTPYVGTLEAGDAAVAAMGGPPVAYYPGGLAFRGQEEDGMAITNGGFGILLAGEADGVEIDQVRVFVAVVPEPATLTMAFAGILGIMGLGRARSRAV
jgi:hypothetical protein